jgi:hypothetical protein
MAIGDLHKFESSSDLNIANNATVSAEHNIYSYQRGSALSFTSDSVTLGPGLYVIYYSENAFTPSTVNNERINIVSWLEGSVSGRIGGDGHGYIRKASGHQSTTLNGFAIHKVELLGEDIQVKIQRTDNSNDTTVDRISGSLCILEIDSSDDYGLFSSNADLPFESPTDLNINNSLFSTGVFTLGGNQVTVNNSGYYLINYSFHGDTVQTGREDVTGEIQVNGTRVEATRSYSYIRGADSCQEFGNSYCGIFELSAGDVVKILIQNQTPAGSFTSRSGARLNLWKIPNSAELFTIDTNSGSWGSPSTFSWSGSIQGNGFSHSNGSSDINYGSASGIFCLSFVNFSKMSIDTEQRLSFALELADSAGSTYSEGRSSTYHRASGSGYVAQTSCAAISLAPNASIYCKFSTNSFVAGSHNNFNARISGLNLTGLYGAYPAKPIIESGTNSISNGGTFTISGASFLSTQGTLELADNLDYALATKITQTIVSWTDDSVTFIADTGSFPDGSVYLFLTNNDGLTSSAFPVYINIPNPIDVYLSFGEDIGHLWLLDSDFENSINSSAAMNTTPFPNLSAGAIAPVSITRASSGSSLYDDVLERREVPDQSDMNTATLTTRTMGGWIMFQSIQKSMSSIYKEGGGVNNLAFLTGIGNVVMAQLADTSDDNAQAYSDFRLKPNRPYQIVFKFDYTAQTPEFRLYIDGIKQSVTSGNPLLSTDLDAHGGDIVFGDSDSNLEMGGTDIAFQGQAGCYYSQWFSGTSWISDEDLYEKLFLLTAKPTHVINNQSDLDAISGTTIPDSPIAIMLSPEIGASSFTIDNINFEDGTTVHIFSIATEPITITTNNSNLDVSKIELLNESATITIIKSVPVELTVLDLADSSEIDSARLLIEAAPGGPLPSGDSPVSLTSAGGVATLTTSKTPNLLKAGDKIFIKGADQQEYNGLHVISSASGQEVNYAVSGSPASPATGAITETAVIFSGETDSNGKAVSSIVYASDQPVSGKIRKVGDVNYKESTFSGQISQLGLTANIFMIRD